MHNRYRVYFTVSHSDTNASDREWKGKYTYTLCAQSAAEAIAIAKVNAETMGITSGKSTGTFSAQKIEALKCTKNTNNDTPKEIK